MSSHHRALRFLGIPVASVIVGVGLIAQTGQAASQNPSTGTPPDQVTFTKDVAPILQRSCQNCHRPNSIGPMSLLTYEDARPWARSIRNKVSTRAMPPWFIDRNVGIDRFKDDRSLKQAEIQTIVAWVDNGAPRGNPADMPPPLKFDDGKFQWSFVPDLVVPIPAPFTVEARGPNQWVDFISDTGLTEDRWIQAFETKPSIEGFPVVHHATTSVIVDGGPMQQLGEYAVGKTADIMPEGSGMLLKAGSKIRWNFHYASVGQRRTDRTSIAFKFYPKGYEPKYKVVRTTLGVMDLDLPAGESNIRTDSYMVLTDNVRITTFQPHLHNRGKRQCLEAIFTDGRVETINCVSWDFGWHIAYNYETDVQPLLPKGTILHTISWHDNSSANKWNPDPRNWIGWGHRSSDDMAFSHMHWFVLSDEEFAQQVKARYGDRTSGRKLNESARNQ